MMISFLIYLLKANILLLLALGCYQLFLKSLSFHQWKRVFLLLGLVLSIAAPLYTWNTYNIIHLPQQKISPTLNIGTESVITAPTSNLTVWLILISSIYFLGLFIASGRLIFNYYQFYKFNQQAILLNKSLNIYHHPKIDIAYSTLRKIYINKNIFQESDLHIIILHEQEHINQKHAIDLHFCNVIKCIFWFNPLINYYQKSISLNHECIVDSYIAKVEDAALYQMQLVKYQSVSPQIDLANQFAISNLKQRILFMNQKKSSVWKLSLFATSVFALVSVGIAMAHQKENKIIWENPPEIFPQEEHLEFPRTDTESRFPIPNIVEKNVQKEKVESLSLIAIDTPVKVKEVIVKFTPRVTIDTVFMNDSVTGEEKYEIVEIIEPIQFGNINLNDFPKESTSIMINGKKSNLSLEYIDPNHIDELNINTKDNGKKLNIDIIIKKEFESQYK